MIAITQEDEYLYQITQTLRDNHLLMDEEISNISKCIRGY